jgi:hypothetical protein
MGIRQLTIEMRSRNSLVSGLLAFPFYVGVSFVTTFLVFLNLVIRTLLEQLCSF